MTRPDDLIETAIRDDFDHFMRRYKNKNWWKCVSYYGRPRCQKLGNRHESLEALNANLSTQFLAYNRTLERAAMDKYKSDNSYGYLTGDADDVDFCIKKRTKFNAAILEQVQVGRRCKLDPGLKAPRFQKFDCEKRMTVLST